MCPLSEGQSTDCDSESDYNRSRSGSFLLGCGFSVLACALALASLHRMELSRFWINRCFVSAINRRHSGSGMASSLRMVLSTTSLVCRSRITSTISFSPAMVSSFAVNGLTVSLARELGPKGIRVNAVAPGITATDMMKAVPKEVIDPLISQIPLRRLGQPEDIANAFVFLASDEASYITGVVLSVDGMART